MKKTQTKPTAMETLGFLARIEKAGDASGEAEMIVEGASGILFPGETETIIRALAKNGGGPSERLEALRAIKAGVARAPLVRRHVEGLNGAGAVLGHTVRELMKGAAVKEAQTHAAMRGLAADVAKAADATEDRNDVVREAVALAKQAVAEGERIAKAYAALEKSPAIATPFRNATALKGLTAGASIAAAAELEQLAEATTDPITKSQLKVMAARANASR